MTITGEIQSQSCIYKQPESDNILVTVHLLTCLFLYSWNNCL